MMRFVVLLLLAGISGLVYNNRNLEHRLQEQTLLAQNEADLLEKAKDDLKREQEKQNAALQDEQSVLQKLQSQYQYESGALDTLKQRLQNARSLSVGGSGDSQAIRQIHSDLDEINRQIKVLEAQDRSLGTQSKYANEMDKQTVASGINNLNGQITASQTRIKAIQDQINLKKRTPSFDQSDALNQLTAQLATERSNLDNLKQQKVELQDQHQYDSMNTDQQVETSRNAIHAQEEQLHLQYSQEKSQLDQLQRDQESRTRSQQSKDQQVHDLQIQVSAQQTKVDAISSQIDLEKRKLQGTAQ